MSGEQPLPVGVVGVGALGRHHARHLAAMPAARLVGVYDRDAERAAAVAAEVGTRAFPDLESLCHSVAAVTIAVPTSAHAEVGLRVLGAGLPVLMEKPLAGTLEEADQLIAEAERRGVQIQVGHIERFNRAVRAAAPYLDGPRYVETQRLAPFQPRGTDVAVVLDLMIHDLDLLIALTGGGEVAELRASGVSVLSPHLDIVNARVEFVGGTVASLTASRVARDRLRRFRLFQPNGYLSLDLAAGTGEFMRLKPGWRSAAGQSLADIVERVELEAPEADALALELASFVNAVRGDHDTVVTGAQGRAALALALQVTAAVGESPLVLSGD
ncbi:MAG TPA: Gfo/Idh/MocA family oxidoreductase [Gemmatimonadales bacterium]|nr:Gfo/Idh/MocA family oxidoreductase [Gemmatimonadales bacterium]